jgi:hypothetical protein
MIDAPVPISDVLVEFVIVTALAVGAGLLTRSSAAAAVAAGRLLIIVVVLLTLLSNSMVYQWGMFVDPSDCSNTLSDWLSGGILFALDLALLGAYLLARRRHSNSSRAFAGRRS